MSQGGRKGRNFTVPPGIHRKEKVPSSCTGWGVGFFLVAQNSCWSSSSWSGRYWEGRSGGILRREAARTAPGREGGAGLGLLSSGEAQADGSCDPREGRENRTGLGFPAAGSHSGNVGGPRVITLISTDQSRAGRALRVPPGGHGAGGSGGCREGAAPSAPRSLGCF